MAYYEAPDEIGSVQSGGMGVEETRKWIMEDMAVTRWFDENPRYETGPSVEVLYIDDTTLIQGREIGRWTMKICPDDLPSTVDELLNY